MGDNVSRCEKIRSPLDIELKLAGLAVLAPEESERHLLMNASRVAAYEAAKLDVVT